MLIPTLEISKEVFNIEIENMKDKLYNVTNYNEFKNYDKEQKEEFLKEIKNTLEIQELLVENKLSISDEKKDMKIGKLKKTNIK